MTRRPRQPANDNVPPAGRRTTNEIPAKLPLLEVELLVIENCFAQIIDRLLGSTANGATGMKEPANEQETKP